MGDGSTALAAACQVQHACPIPLAPTPPSCCRGSALPRPRRYIIFNLAMSSEPQLLWTAWLPAGNIWRAAGHAPAQRWVHPSGWLQGTAAVCCADPRAILLTPPADSFSTVDLEQLTFPSQYKVCARPVPARACGGGSAGGHGLAALVLRLLLPIMDAACLPTQCISQLHPHVLARLRCCAAPHPQVDYVRVYQDPSAFSLGCSPKDYPTAQYLAWWVETDAAVPCRARRCGCLPAA